MPPASNSKTLPPSASCAALLRATLVPLDFVLPGFKRGTVGGLISPGGVGKSFWTLALGVSMASMHIDLTGMQVEKGRVVVFSAEDDEDVIAQRLQAMRPYLEEDNMLAQLDLRSCVGLNIDIMEAGWFAQLVDVCKGARLVVLDTLSRFHTLDENSAPDMKRLLAQLEILAQSSGAAVLYLHHTSKAAITSGFGSLQQAARGSSVLVDNARWMSFIAGMSESEARQYGIADGMRANYVRWNVSKQNYGKPLPDLWYVRGEGGVLLPCVIVEERLQVSITEKSHEQALVESHAHPVGAGGLASANGAYDGNW